MSNQNIAKLQSELDQILADYYAGEIRAVNAVIRYTGGRVYVESQLIPADDDVLGEWRLADIFDSNLCDVTALIDDCDNN